MSRYSPSKYRSTNNSSNRIKAYWDTVGTGTPVEEIDQFLTTKNLEKRKNAIEKIEKSNQLKSIYYLGLMSIEMARDDKAMSSQWLERAQENLNKVINFDTGKYYKYESLHAMRTLDMMPHFFSLFVEDKLVSRDWMKKMYENSQVSSHEAISSYNYFRKSQNNQHNQKQKEEIIGQLSESAVNLLGLRFGIELGDSSWIMAPSLFSEDHKPFNDGCWEQNNWDLSVYTPSNNTYDIPYKIQVKSRHNSGYNDKIYKDDIIMLYVQEDLMLVTDKQNDGISTKIIREIQSEKYVNDYSVTNRLKERTNSLLDKLG